MQDTRRCWAVRCGIYNGLLLSLMVFMTVRHGLAMHALPWCASLLLAANACFFAGPLVEWLLGRFGWQHRGIGRVLFLAGLVVALPIAAFGVNVWIGFHPLPTVERVLREAELAPLPASARELAAAGTRARGIFGLPAEQTLVARFAASKDDIARFVARSALQLSGGPLTWPSRLMTAPPGATITLFKRTQEGDAQVWIDWSARVVYVAYFEDD